MSYINKMQVSGNYFYDLLKIKTDIICIIAIMLLLFCKLWGWIFTKTIFSSPLVDRILVLSILGIFTYILVYKKHKTEISGWIVYLLLSIIGFLVWFNIYGVVEWIAYYVILALALNYNFFSSTIAKFIFWSGIILSIGVFFQFFFPTLYIVYIERLFVIERNLLEDVVSVEDLNGMRGFTYQTGVTSNLIFYGLIVFLYFKEEVMPKMLNKTIFTWTLIAIMVVAIFFTGKRMISVTAVIVPLLTFILSSKSSGKKIAFIVLGILAMFFAVEFLVPILLTSFDFFAIRRLAETFESAQAGDDITTGRSYLWGMAIDAWKDHPLLGVGIGKFKDYTGAITLPHNTFLQVLCEQGLLGFIFYLIAIVGGFIFNLKVLRRVNGQIRQPLKMSLAFQLMYIIYAFSGNVNNDFGLLFLIIGMAVTMRINYLDKIQKIHSKRNLV